MASVIYIARITNKESLGIINKVKNTIKCIRSQNYDSSYYISNDKWFIGTIKLINKILTVKDDLIILRSDHHTMLFMFIPLIIARIRGIKIIIDIPNPIYVAANEVNATKSNFLIKFIKKLLLRISFPLSLLPAHKILEYGYDSLKYTYFLRNKIKVVGNGVLTDEIPFRLKKPPLNNRLNLIGAAHIAFWHAFDRIIKSIDTYNRLNYNNPNKFIIHFYIVGEGFEKKNLEKLVKELNLESYVHFEGLKSKEKLTESFTNAHIAVSSLGVFRKNISFLSDLKTREYTARAIPSIVACEDIDFTGNIPFLYKCKNDESLLNFDEIIKWYKNLDNNYENFEFIRNYAIEKLDYKIKIHTDILSIFNNKDCNNE